MYICNLLIIVLLSCCVEKSNSVHFPCHSHVHRVVVEHCGRVLIWEAVCGVGDQHAGLPYRAVPHNHNWAAMIHHVK